MVRESLGDPTRGPIGESLRGDSSTTLVSKVSGPEDRSTLYLEALRDILFNLPTELGNFGRIPCAQRSIYSGVLVGGIVSAISLICTGRLGQSFRFGFFSYLGTSILAWEYCNLRHRDKVVIHGSTNKSVN